MGIWDWLPGRKAAANETKGVAFSDEWANYYAITQSKSGISVDWERALDVTTVLACARVLCNGVAQVPLRVMKELAAGGSEPAKDHPLYKVLYRKPNGWQTSFAMRETMMLHLVLAGNAFFYKNMVRNRVKSLIPIDPGSVSVKRNRDYSLEYTVAGVDGSSQVFPQSLIWHIRGPSWDNWRGLDAVRRAREAIGLAIATESTQAEAHANGLQMSGTYATEQKISPDEYKKIQAWIAAQVGGPNKHKPFIIDAGFKWTPQSMTGVDAQHLETRKYQVEQICAALGVLPPMIGHAGQSMTFASAEQIFLAHVVHSLMPWFVRIEQSIDNDLLDGSEDEGYFAKFNANSLMRGASKDRAEFYSKALGTGGSPAYMTQDEIRALEDLNPMGGDAAALPKPTNVGGAQPEQAPGAKDNVK